MKELSIRSESPLEEIWLHLSLYESEDLAKKLIREKANNFSRDLNDEILREKAKGLSYCIRNAHEYFDQPAASWNSRLLNGYYGLMAFIGAVMIADPRNNFTLVDFEIAMQQGHGMALKSYGELDLSQELIFILKDGLLIKYLKHIDVNIDEFSVVRNSIPKTKDSSGSFRTVSLIDLLGTIPEIADIFYIVTGRLPLSTRVHRYGPTTAEVDKDLMMDFGYDIDSKYYSDENDLVNAGFTFNRYKKDSPILPGIRGFFRGKSENDLRIPIFQFGDQSYIFKPPIQPIVDIFAVHMMTMYALSIVVRYKPNTWRSIIEGQNDAYFTLIRAYYRSYSRNMPQMILEQLLGKHIDLLSPGATTWT